MLARTLAAAAATAALTVSLAACSPAADTAAPTAHAAPSATLPAGTPTNGAELVAITGTVELSGENAVRTVAELIKGGYDVVQEDDLVVGYLDGIPMTAFYGDLASVIDEARALAEQEAAAGADEPAVDSVQVVDIVATYLADGYDVAQDGKWIVMSLDGVEILSVEGDLASIIDEARALAATL